MREFKIYTGTAGMERIDRAIRDEMEYRNMMDYLDYLFESQKISADELSSLESMIDSPDKGNRVVAVEILKNRYNYVASMSNM
jgi:hypothetical protein